VDEAVYQESGMRYHTSCAVPCNRLFDFFSRINGWTQILSGALMTAVLLFAFRRSERWA
jgi:hypothetical protein